MVGPGMRLRLFPWWAGCRGHKSVRSFADQCQAKHGSTASHVVARYGLTARVMLVELWGSTKRMSEKDERPKFLMLLPNSCAAVPFLKSSPEFCSGPVDSKESQVFAGEDLEFHKRRPWSGTNASSSPKSP